MGKHRKYFPLQGEGKWFTIIKEATWANSNQAGAVHAKELAAPQAHPIKRTATVQSSFAVALP